MRWAVIRNRWTNQLFGSECLTKKGPASVEPTHKTIGCYSRAMETNFGNIENLDFYQDTAGSHQKDDAVTMRQDRARPT